MTTTTPIWKKAPLILRVEQPAPKRTIWDRLFRRYPRGQALFAVVVTENHCIIDNDLLYAEFWLR